MDTLWTLSLDNIYTIKYSTYTGVGETDRYRYDKIFIMVDISEVSCGAHNDKSPYSLVSEVSCGARNDSPLKQ